MPRPDPIFSEDGRSVSVPLTRGRYALVDVADWPLVSPFNWMAIDPCGNGPSWYAARSRCPHEGRGSIKLHQFLTNWEFVDHISGDGLDNRRANLRRATNQQNCANRRRRADSRWPYKGIQLLPSGNWRGKLQGRHLGVYPTPEDAARAYDAAARETFGEFARVNFPEGS